MAETPKRIVVHLELRGADEELKRLFRRMVRPPAPQPQRRSLWRRLLLRLRGR